MYLCVCEQRLLVGLVRSKMSTSSTLTWTYRSLTVSSLRHRLMFTTTH